MYTPRDLVPTKFHELVDWLRDEFFLISNASLEIEERVTEVFYPTSVNTAVGTVIAGDVNTVKELDGSYYQVQEITGAPPSGGFDVIFDFVNVLQLGTIQLWGRYEGSSSHKVYVQMYDYVLGGWRNITRLSSDANDYFYSFTVPEKNFLSNGAARVRFYHSTNGVSTHHLYIGSLGVTGR